MSNQYRIEQLGDFLKVPADRIHDCMKELADHFQALRQTLDNFGLEAQGDELKKFTWQDDGKQDLTLKVTNDDAVMTVKLSKGDSEELS